MKSIFFLNALDLNDFAFNELASGKSAFRLTCEKAINFSKSDKVIILTTGNLHSKINDEVKLINSNKISVQEVQDCSAKAYFNTVNSLSSDYDNVLIGFADSPFLDLALTEQLYNQHIEYKAEYSFADGYPLGFAPDIIAQGLASILAGLTDIADIKKERNFIFETVKKDINSFDLETLIAPHDLRHLRLEFYANSKRNFTLCKNLNGVNAENYNTFINEHSEDLFLQPAYYAIEIADSYPFDSCYLPKAKNDFSNQFMSKENAFSVIKKIADFSDDAVISLSIFGEPALHPELESIIEYILSFEKLSVLIETTGLHWTDERINSIFEIVNKSKQRENKKQPIYWIVFLDAMTEKQYAKIHSITEGNAIEMFNEACRCVERLFQTFGEVVYPQFMRMKENEEELESFYRFWSEKVKNVIIQKYNHFCKKLPDRRVADLSPLTRHPCWHIQRDMYINTDGNVLLCQNDISAENKPGNVFTDDFSDIRNKAFDIYKDHLTLNYKGLCENCDEYYTYNF